jgi:hypothetical protein
MDSSASLRIAKQWEAERSLGKLPSHKSPAETQQVLLIKKFPSNTGGNQFAIKIFHAKSAGRGPTKSIFMNEISFPRRDRNATKITFDLRSKAQAFLLLEIL